MPEDTGPAERWIPKAIAVVVGTPVLERILLGRGAVDDDAAGRHEVQRRGEEASVRVNRGV